MKDTKKKKSFQIKKMSVETISIKKKRQLLNVRDTSAAVTALLTSFGARVSSVVIKLGIDIPQQQHFAIFLPLRSFVLIICISLLKQRSVLRNTGNELVSHCR